VPSSSGSTAGVAGATFPPPRHVEWHHESQLVVSRVCRREPAIVMVAGEVRQGVRPECRCP
jgi:hypothetical protein